MEKKTPKLHAAIILAGTSAIRRNTVSFKKDMNWAKHKSEFHTQWRTKQLIRRGSLSCLSGRLKVS